MIDGLPIAFLVAAAGIAFLSLYAGVRRYRNGGASIAVAVHRAAGIAPILTILLAICLSNCALFPGGDDDSGDSPNGQAKVRLVDSGKVDTDWWVTDSPETKRVYVSPTAGRATSLSLVGSLVLSPSMFLPPQEDYQKVAMQFLNQTGRPGCQIIAGSQVSRFQYRFEYNCSATR